MTALFLRRISFTALAFVFMLFTALSIWHGTNAAWSDASTLRARSIVNGWRDGIGPGFTPQLWQAAHDDLQSALQTSPGNPQLFIDLGFLFAARAQGLGIPLLGSQEQLQQQKLLVDAAASYRASTILRPTFPYGWAYLALVKHLQGQRDAEFWAAFDKAVKYGTNEAGIQPALAQMAFAQWATLGVERQQRIASMVATAQTASQKRLLDIAELYGVSLPSP